MKRYVLLVLLLVTTVGISACRPNPVMSEPESHTPTPQPTSTPSPIYHVVMPGDAITAIAELYGVSESMLISTNYINNPDLIYVGQRLFIPNPTLPVSQSPGKRILVNMTQQRLYAYEGTDQILVTSVTTGAPGTDTRTGTFEVQSKLPDAYSSYYNVNMPYWLGIYWVGSLENGIHTMPLQEDGMTGWESRFGYPSTPGCVILGYEQAQNLYKWADTGTPVIISY